MSKIRIHVLVAIACLSGPGCASQAGPRDAQSDADRDGLDADVPGGDADADGDASDAGDGGDADATGPQPTRLPIGPEAVFRLGDPGAIDMGCAAWAEPDGRIWVVWERFDAEFTLGGLWLASWAEGSDWSPASALLAGGPSYRASPSFARLAGQGWLYVVDATDLYSPPSLRRATIVAGEAGAPESIPDVEGVDSLLSWPRFLGLHDGRLALAFRDSVGRTWAAYSANGVSFDQPVGVHPASAAMATLGQAPDGWLAYAYQTDTARSMTSWVRTSSDGLTWSEPVQVTDASTNVHDTALVPRVDGGLDLYYIYPCSAAGFCLHRRALGPTGLLGAEELVTEPEVGETSKPEGLRLPDGGLLLLWAEISRRGAGGAPTEQILTGTFLIGDAPAIE